MAQAETTRTTRRDLLRFAAAAAPAALLAMTTVPAAACEEPEFEKLLGIFERLWEGYLPVHQRFSEACEDDVPDDVHNQAHREWCALDGFVQHAGESVLEYEAVTARGRGLKAAACIATNTISNELGSELSLGVINFLLEVAAAGGVAVPDYAFC